MKKTALPVGKVYIAGPMTGYANYNAEAFNAAKRRWTVQGADVQTPFNANSRVWRRHHGRDFNPYTDRCDYGDPILTEMFVEDVQTLAVADTIVLLDGWEESKGARAEAHLAALLGKRIMLDSTGEEIDIIVAITSLSAGAQPETGLFV